MATAICWPVGAPLPSRIGFATAGRTETSEFAILLAAIPLVAAVVITKALGFTPMSEAALGGTILASLASPAVGLAALAFLAPIGAPPIVPAPGFDFLLVGAILVGCVYRLPIDRPRIRLSVVPLTLVGFVLYAFTQQLPEMLGGYVSVQDHDVGYLLIQLLICFGTILAAIYVLSDRSPYPFLVMGLAGAVLVALLAIATFESVSLAGPITNLVSNGEDRTRALGPFSNPNYLGAFAAIIAVGAASLATHARSRRGTVALLAVSALVGTGVVLSLSRGAILAAFAGFAWLALARSRVLAGLVIAIGIVGALVIYPAFVQWRLESLTGSASSAAYLILAESDQGRLTGVLAGPQLFLSAPVFGIGFGHYVPMSVLVTGSPDPINAHNWYLTVLAEQGIVGVALLGVLAVALVRALMTRPSMARTVGAAVLGALATAALFLEPPTSFQTLAAPSIILVAALVGNWERQSISEPSRTERDAGDLRRASTETA